MSKYLKEKNMMKIFCWVNEMGIRSYLTVEERGVFEMGIGETWVGKMGTSQIL